MIWVVLTLLWKHFSLCGRILCPTLLYFVIAICSIWKLVIMSLMSEILPNCGATEIMSIEKTINYRRKKSESGFSAGMTCLINPGSYVNDFLGK